MRIKKINYLRVEKPQKEECLITEWLTRRQASKYLQIGISTLDSRIPIKKYYIGKSVRYYTKDLDEYLRSNCKEPMIKKKV